MAKLLFHALVGSENPTRACFPFLQAVANKERGDDVKYAEIDLKLITASKRTFDVAGHYARPDVFKFMVNRESNPVMQVTDSEAFD
jgi:hypothetical protein